LKRSNLHCLSPLCGPHDHSNQIHSFIPYALTVFINQNTLFPAGWCIYRSMILDQKVRINRFILFIKKGWVWIPLSSLSNLSRKEGIPLTSFFSSCTNTWPECPGLCRDPLRYNDLKCVAHVPFIDIGAIVDHYCFKFSYS
jgi:hypothetical protein